MIHLNNVYVLFQNHSVFHDLNFSIESGVSYLLTGANGAGKTTVLKLIAGDLQPRQGSVIYDFIDPQLDWDEKFQIRKKAIHFVPTHALHDLIRTPDLFYQQRYYTIESTPLATVRDYLGERIHELERMQFLASFQLQHLLGLEITQLSNGQVKKLIILKQLLDAIPKILLLDYPFEGLDEQSRVELRDFLDHLADVHHLQLIIADHDHPHLPKAITKKGIVMRDEIFVTDYAADAAIPVDEVPHPKPAVKYGTVPVVEMEDVTIQYGDNVIIEKLTWRINRGERWALTGRNGSGKTTLFSLIYADHPMAYSQKVFLFGKRRGTGESIWDIKKRISYLGPEQLHFLDHITEQLSVQEFLERSSATSGRWNELIDHFQLHALLLKKVGQLSHGQLQLILMVALFLSQRELLLLDEPFQFLDPHHKKQVSQYLEAHMDESVTLVIITHYESDVARWSNHRKRL
jgi:molybdate transport system ATP-binding protein